MDMAMGHRVRHGHVHSGNSNRSVMVGRKGEMSTWGEFRPLRSIQDDAWYAALIDALAILGKKWDSETTDDEDAFVLAYADEVARRPEHERD
jgi:hypothetical protein